MYFKVQYQFHSTKEITHTIHPYIEWNNVLAFRKLDMLADQPTA